MRSVRLSVLGIHNDSAFLGENKGCATVALNHS